MRVCRIELEKEVDEISETTKLFEMAGPSESTRHSLRLLKQNNPTELPLFEFSAILVATNHFSPMNKLGQGGFGSVYKVIIITQVVKPLYTRPEGLVSNKFD